MAKLSVVIITENKEKLIADAANYTSFADEVLVVDCGSTNKKCDIAEELGARVRIWVGRVPELQKTRRLGLPAMTGCSY